MSGIFGIYRLDGASVSETDLEIMLQKLKHRGPDGLHRWQSGPVGLGHCMLQTTPESLFEQLPSHRDSCTITADARIDNREELYEKLAVNSLQNLQPLDQVTDSDLILWAYQQWGEDCVDHLLGDFVFAIWDGDHQQLFCARDHFGLRPFYYHLCDNFFAFASEAKALLCLSEVSQELNEERVVDYLISNFSDKESTSFISIRRLAPANCITLTRGSHITKTYWCLDQTRELFLASDEAYSQKFLEIFTEAVRCRLRSAYPIATTLSGGLDSSSVTCMARRLLAESGIHSLSTVSGVFKKITECDESQFIDAVIAQGGIDPLYFYPDQKGPLTEIESFLWHQDEPSPGLGDGTMVIPMYQVLKNKGIRVLLGGVDGDTTVSHGYGYLRELAESHDWFGLYRECKGVSKIYGDPVFPYFFSYFWPFFLFSVLGKPKTRRLVGLLRRARKYFVKEQNKATSLITNETIISTSLANRVNVTKRKKIAEKLGFGVGETEREVHYSAVNQGLQSFSLEILNKTSIAFSIEERCPFWDKRLVEFCLALPAKQKLRNGWTRYILRQSMEGILPDEVRWRYSKMNFVPNVSHGLFQINRTRLEHFLSRRFAPVQTYLDIEALRNLYQRLLNAKSNYRDSLELFTLCNCAVLGIWIWHRKNHEIPDFPLSLLEFPEADKVLERG